jgi:uncharacterized protein (DUF2141 family)
MNCKTLSLAVVLSLLSVGAAQACTTIEFRNVKPKAGFVMAAVYDSAESYNKKPMSGLRLAADGATVSHKLCGMEGKQIAISAFQDLNEDGKMNFNIMGMPTEPWGASGKPSAFGAPTWATTVVTVSDAAIVVEF